MIMADNIRTVAEIQAAQDALKDQAAKLGIELDLARQAERDAARKAEAARNAEFADRMFREYGQEFGLPREVFDKAYSLAWDAGHASGFSEIEGHLGGFAQLALDAYQAGYAAGRKSAWPS